MKAVNDFLIIKKEEEGEVRTKAGIILPSFNSPDEIQEPFIGEIISVGDQIKNYKIGDRVLFSDLSSPEVILIGDTMFIVVKEKDIIGVLQKNE